MCISRPEGAGGAEVGRIVSERLGFAYVDEEIVAAAAAKGGISAEDVADEEQRKRALGRLLQEIGRGAVDRELRARRHGLATARGGSRPTGFAP